MGFSRISRLDDDVADALELDDEVDLVLCSLSTVSAEKVTLLALDDCEHADELERRSCSPSSLCIQYLAGVKFISLFL